MKFLVLLFFLLIGSARAESLPGGAMLSFLLKGASDGVLEVTPDARVIVVLTFSNPTESPVRFRFYDRDSYHGKLPYPADCAARITDSSGTLHPHAKSNGEWWSQYICWSTFFPANHEPSMRTLKSGETFSCEVSLADVLAVPAGGEPTGWPYQHKTGFASGRHLARFRYGLVTSEQFTLVVRAR